MTTAAMLEARPTPHALERELGMEYHVTATPGTGGRLRAEPEDFLVEEVLGPVHVARGPGKYTLATVRARNWETNRLLLELAKRLSLRPGSIFFAGTKDKRAITVQALAFPASEDRVRRISLRDVEILDTMRVDRAPKIGELLGNRFTIAVRDMALPLADAEDHARATVDALQALGGVPNYFGPQRFGVLRPNTHVVGRLILEGRLEDAVVTYVGEPGPTEAGETRAAREAFLAHRDPIRALGEFPEHLLFERICLTALAERPGDHGNALLRLPRNLLTMFVYAHGSLLFNRIVSARIREGLPLGRALVGDVVLAATAEGRPDDERRVPVTPANLDRVDLALSRGLAFVSGLVPGHAPPLAEGRMGDIEAAVLRDAGLPPAAFRSAALPECASAGTRRALLAPILEPSVSAGTDARGDHVDVRFELGRGSYATCTMREVTKCHPTKL